MEYIEKYVFQCYARIVKSWTPLSMKQILSLLILVSYNFNFEIIIGMKRTFSINKKRKDIFGLVSKIIPFNETKDSLVISDSFLLQILSLIKITQNLFISAKYTRFLSNQVRAYQNSLHTIRNCESRVWNIEHIFIMRLFELRL